jgi:hypothetical protein
MEDEQETAPLRFVRSEVGNRRILALSIFIGYAAYRCMKHVVDVHLESVNKVIEQYGQEE